MNPAWQRQAACQTLHALVLNWRAEALELNALKTWLRTLLDYWHRWNKVI
jgi:hypothetical protein